MGEYSQVDATKSELVNTVRVSWKGGETVYVYDGTKYLGSLVSSLDGDEDRYALLSTDGEQHKIAVPTAGTTKLTLVHGPSLTEAPAISNGVVSISLSDQSSPKVPFVAYATLDYNNETAITNLVVPFKFATSVIKVNCTGLKASTAITFATLSNVNTACKLSLSGNAAPTITGDVNGIITRTGDTYFAARNVNNEGEAVFQLALPALASTTQTRTLTISQGPNLSKDKNFTKKSLSPATSVNTVSQMVALPKGALPGEFTVADPDGVPNSGDEKKVCFSRGNLYYDGANWGFEIEQNYFRTYEGKGVYNEDGYNATSGTASGHWGLFGWSTDDRDNVAYGMDTRTNNIHYRGNFKDWGTALDNKGTWRTLTGGENGEWDYLAKHHVYYWGELGETFGVFIAPDGFNGVEKYDLIVYLVSRSWETAQEEGVVFLPGAGFRLGTSIDHIYDPYRGMNRGHYWSSSLSGNESAYSVDQEEVITTNNSNRYKGLSVRLVTDLK